MNKIKVLIVDDSALVRQMLSNMLNEDDEIQVIGTAIDPVFAIQKIMRDPPDVITLDVEMPRMDGLTFLEKLMISYPTPVVMISSHTKKGCDTTLRALELGAVDFIAKPERNTLTNLEKLKYEIIAKVKNAARVNLKAAGRIPSKDTKHASNLGSELKVAVHELPDENDRRHPEKLGTHLICAIGASTGGVTAIRAVVEKLHPKGYSIIIVLHMPPGFTKSFAERLGSLNGWISFEAVDGQMVEAGKIYVAPGGKNMTVEKRNKSIFIRVRPCEVTDVFKPNVNKMFESVARNIGPEAVGVILTGMGDDGAKGMLKMRQAGAVTIAQDAESCMVFGMPKKAIEAGGVDYTVPLELIASKLANII